MKRSAILLFFLIIVSVCSVYSMEYSREDTILVVPGGNAQVTRREFIPASALALLYRIHWDLVEESGEERDFFSQASTELKFLIPGKLDWKSASGGPEIDSFSRNMEGQITGFSAYESRKDIWTIETGPSEKLMEEYFELVFSQMMFQTMFLESLERPPEQFKGQFNDGVIIHKKITRIVLPVDSEIMNLQELEGLEWLVDFGGGSKMTAALSIDGNSILLTESLHLSLSRPTLFLERGSSFIMSLYDYARFEVEYRLPERRASLPGSECKEPGPDDWAGDFYQNFSGLELSAEVDIPLSGMTNNATPACSLTLSAKPSAPLSAHIAWDINFHWDWWDSSWELNYFQAWIDASPQLELTVEFEAKMTFAEIEKTLLSKSYPVAKIAFSIGVVPVYINIVLYGELKAEVEAYGKLTAETGITLGVNLKAGARYESGWSNIVEFDPFYTIRPLEIDAEVGATATGKLEVGAHALLYDIAGPYIAVIPSLEAGLKTSISEGLEPVLVAKLEAAAGIDIAGWLKSIIGDIGSVTIEIGESLEKDLIPEIEDLLDWNRSPSASAGNDSTVNEGETVSLDGGSSSDPDSDALSFMWSQISGQPVQIHNPTAEAATFTAPELPKYSQSELRFKLEVNDGRGGVSSDTVTITVIDVNKPPMSSVGDQTVDEGLTLTVDLSSFVSDPDEDILTVAKISGPGGIANGIFTFSPGFTASGSYTVKFSVSDGRGGSVIDQFAVSVNDINRAPVASISPVDWGNVSEGSEVAFDASGSTDPDGDALIYFWSVSPAFSIENAIGPQVTFVAPEQLSGQQTEYTVTLVVRDPGSLTSTVTAAFAVSDINHPPVADAGAEQSVQEGSTVTLDGSACEDQDLGDQLTYTWILPGGVQAEGLSEPILSFVAPDVPWGSERQYTFSLTVSDLGGAEASDTVTVTVGFVNTPPVADAGPDRETGANYPVSFTTGESFDPDEGDYLIQYRWDFGDGTGTGWKETSENMASHIYTEYGACNLVLTVKDSLGATASDSCTVEVSELVLQLISDDDILDFEAADGLMHNYNLGGTFYIESIECVFNGRDIVRENPLNPKDRTISAFSGIVVLISMDGFNWTPAGSSGTSPASIVVGAPARYLRILPVSGHLVSSSLSVGYRGSSEESLSNVDCYSSGFRVHDQRQHEYSLPEEKVILEYEVEIAGNPRQLDGYYSVYFERPGETDNREANGQTRVMRQPGNQGAYRREKLFELVDKVVIGEFQSRGFSKICFSYAEPVEISSPEGIDSAIENEYGDWYCVDGSKIRDVSLVVSASSSSSLYLKLVSSDGTIYESMELSGVIERHYIDPVQGKLYIGIVPLSASQEAVYSLRLSSREDSETEPGESMESAASIESSASVSGKLSRETPENWYKILVQEGQIIKLDLQVPEDARFVVQLKDGKGVTKRSTTGSGEIASAEYVAGATGEWFVRVYRSSGSGAYRLTVSISNQNDAGSLKDAGDESNTSISLTPGQYEGFLKISDNEDWYAVEIAKGQIISVQLSTESGGGFYGSFIRENGSAISGSSFSKGSPGSIDYCAGYTGPIYIKISRSSGEGEYGLDIGLRSQDDGGSGADAGEAIEDSLLIGIGESSGELKNADDTDLYSVEVSKGQIVSVQLSTESGGRFYGSFVAENGGSISGSSFSRGSPGSIDYCVDYTGLLYIKITRSSGEGVYNLNVEVSNQNDADSGSDAGEEAETAIQIDAGSVAGRLKHSDSEDWFVFQATSGDIITIEADPEDGLNYSVALRYTTKQGIATAGSITISDNPGEIRYCTKDSGSHYIRIHRSSGEGEYIFSVLKTPQNDANSGGDAGDSISRSTPLPVITQFGATYTGKLLSKDNDDWYSLGTLPTGTLNITLNASGGRFYLYLYNANASQVANSNNYSGDQTIAYSVVNGGGLWYLRVNRNSGEGDYTLSISRVPQVP